MNIKNILFLDIETVPETQSFAELDPLKQELFSKKTAYQRKDEITADEFYERAGIWAEFGKIICISVGFFDLHSEKPAFRIKSFFGDDERKILLAFKNLLDKFFSKPEQVLCAHNGKEFDFPFIARRMIVHSIALPEKLQLFGKKPWEVAHLDTMEMWKFGDFKHYTSLNLLTNILGIPSPKEDIDGSQVAKVYYEDQDLLRIVKYCERDTLAVAQVYLRLTHQPILEEDQVLFVEN
ncbi:3'-5' exonuclease [Namhaeicola litoreus]|uniref:3'-5' exonuclease n=1 Tax=Namhaeicola litoreus TaxID=1052145 RepID=A0ABW3Y1Z0_9FLAO